MPVGPFATATAKRTGGGEIYRPQQTSRGLVFPGTQCRYFFFGGTTLSVALTCGCPGAITSLTQIMPSPLRSGVIPGAHARDPKLSGHPLTVIEAGCAILRTKVYATTLP